MLKENKKGVNIKGVKMGFFILKLSRIETSSIIQIQHLILE